MSLRRRIQVLAAATVLPVAALLVVNSYSSWRGFEESAERTALNQAGLLAGNLRATLEGARQVAKAIVAHVQDAPVDEEACSAYLQAVVRAEPRYFGAAIFRPDGTPWCRSTPASPSRPEISVADRQYFQNALRESDLVVGDMIQGRVVERPALPVALSYRADDGSVTGVVLLPLNLQELTQSLAGDSLAEHGFVLIVDRENDVAAALPDDAAAIATNIPMEVRKALYEGGQSVLRRMEFRERHYVVGLVPLTLPSPGLVVMVGLDRDIVLASAWTILARSLAMAGLVIAVAILVAWWLGHRLIAIPIRRFVDAAQRQAAGDRAARFPEARPATELGRLGSALNAMVAELERLIEQKTLLIREVQHRVMNSLQLLSAFLHLQSRQVADATVRKYLMDARERILSLSVIYRHLYHSEATSTVEFSETLRALCDEMSRTYFAGDAAGIEVRAEQAEMSMETALSLALVVHELVTNAMKHAYGNGSGPLLVELERVGDRFRLAVTDEGKGLPDDFAMEERDSLGMTVIQTLTRQLHGEISVERRARGARFVLTFPANRPRAA